MTGTPAFMAPEVFARSFGRPSDMWSLGMLAYQALSDRCPPPTHSLRFNLTRDPGATTCLPGCSAHVPDDCRLNVVAMVLGGLRQLLLAR